jgi:transcriptional regulator GlxA family with amidase domain
MTTVAVLPCCIDYLPYTGTMLKNVAVVALNGVAPFELGVMCEVFGIDRSAQGLPRYDFALCAADPVPIRTSVGFTIDTPHRLDRLEEADLISLPAASPYDREDYPEELLDALRRAVARGARVMSVCSGAFVLGTAGLLDGRRCTTHWMYADILAAMYPRAKVDPDVLYVDDGSVLTSAGTASGIDLCLHLVREEQGTRVANAIARRMVVPPHRDGGQAQYVDTPVPGPRPDTLEGVLTWLTANLDQEVTVDSLAARALMSPRTFARRFRAETGTTPHRWITGQRVLLAQRLLEETDETIDVVAERSGFGNAATLRHHFGRWRHTTPQAYRRVFRRPVEQSA